MLIVHNYQSPTENVVQNLRELIKYPTKPQEFDGSYQCEVCNHIKKLV